MISSLGSFLAGTSATTTATPLAPGAVLRRATDFSGSAVSFDPNIAYNTAASSIKVPSTAPVELQLTGAASTGSPRLRMIAAGNFSRRAVVAYAADTTRTCKLGNLSATTRKKIIKLVEYSLGTAWSIRHCASSTLRGDYVHRE